MPDTDLQHRQSPSWWSSHTGGVPISLRAPCARDEKHSRQKLYSNPRLPWPEYRAATQSFGHEASESSWLRWSMPRLLTWAGLAVSRIPGEWTLVQGFFSEMESLSSFLEKSKIFLFLIMGITLPFFTRLRSWSTVMPRILAASGVSMRSWLCILNEWLFNCLRDQVLICLTW